MKIRFLIANAYSVGGTIRTTFNTASALADRHDVEIVSVLRRRDEPELELDPRVRLRALTDMRADRRARAAEWASQQPSRVFHRHDFRYKGFNVYSDVQPPALPRLRPRRRARRDAPRPQPGDRALRPALGRARRPGPHEPRRLPAAAARSIARYYPRLDLVTALTQGSAEEYADLLGGRGRVETMPNGVTGLGLHRADPGAKLVVAAGRLGRRKGFDRLLTSMGAGRARVP